MVHPCRSINVMIKRRPPARGQISCLQYRICARVVPAYFSTPAESLNSHAMHQQFVPPSSLRYRQDWPREESHRENYPHAIAHIATLTVSMTSPLARIWLQDVGLYSPALIIIPCSYKEEVSKTRKKRARCMHKAMMTTKDHDVTSALFNV